MLRVDTAGPVPSVELSVNRDFFDDHRLQILVFAGITLIEQRDFVILEVRLAVHLLHEAGLVVEHLYCV